MSELSTPAEVVFDDDDIGVSPREESSSSHDRLLRQWQSSLHVLHIAHSRAAVSFDGRARGLGVTTTVVSTAVGTSLFTSIAAAADTRLIAFAAALSVVAAVASALQTSLNYGELASRHRAAATGYGDLRRQAEVLIEFGAENELAASMARIRQSWNQLEGDAPAVPQNIFDAAKASVVGSESR